MVQLTEQMIIAKSRQDNIAYLKNLNMWGNDIDDVSVLSQMPSVEVISLSVNNISTLKHFGACVGLSELYLRKNNICDLREVRYLARCKGLKVLWLSENPCADSPHYRLFVIQTLPQLMKLDNTDVSQEERTRALKERFPQDLNEPIREADDPHDIPRRNSIGNQQVTRSPSAGSDGFRKARASEPVRDSRETPKGRNTPNLNERVQDEAESEQFTPQHAAPRIMRGSRPSNTKPERPTSGQMNGQHNSYPVERESHMSQPASGQQSNSNVFVAISYLLNELDPDSLRQLRAEIDKRLLSRNLNM